MKSWRAHNEAFLTLSSFPLINDPKSFSSATYRVRKTMTKHLAFHLVCMELHAEYHLYFLGINIMSSSSPLRGIWLISTRGLRDPSNPYDYPHTCCTPPVYSPLFLNGTATQHQCCFNYRNFRYARAELLFCLRLFLPTHGKNYGIWDIGYASEHTTHVIISQRIITITFTWRFHRRTAQRY